MHIRVITLNVWNTEGDARRYGLINRELRRLRPDLLALQEVVQTPQRRTLDQLAERLDLHVTHQQDVQPYTPPYAEKYGGGSAVATRWPHKIVEVMDARTPASQDVPWATLAAKVDLGETGELLFVGTTAAWRSAAEIARERHALRLAELDARQRTALPTIIAGDLNAGPDTASIRFLTGRQSLDGASVCYHDSWEVAGSGPGHTWTVDNPNAAAVIEQIIGQRGYRRRFDCVLVGSWAAHPKASASVQSATLIFDQPVDGLWLSDHFGVMVDLEVTAV